MFTITDRLVKAKEASNPTTHAEDEQTKAGREAENDLVKKIIAQRGVTANMVFCRLRVPDEFQRSKHEIDLVVVTGSTIYAIEVKNWSSEVIPTADGKHWIQKKRSKSGGQSEVQYEIKHDNPVEILKYKTHLLRKHLMRNEACIKERNFESKVVFVNANCKLDQKIIDQSKGCVITPEECANFILSFEQSYLSSFASSLIPSFISGQLSYGMLETSRSVLSNTGTWDCLDLHGGRCLTGDFKGLGDLSPNRREVGSMGFSHQRSVVMGSVWALMGYSPSIRVTLYARGGEGWLWNAVAGSANLPFNSDVLFRVVGEDVDSKIPVNEVDKITLSI